MAEQFALQQLRRQSRAVHAHQFRLRSATQVVQRMRHQFLASARFALDQHRRPRRRHLAHRVKTPRQRRRLAQDLFQREFLLHLLLQRDILVLDRPTLQRPLDQNLQRIDVQRLRYKIIGTPLHCLHRRIHRAIGSHHDTDRRLAHLQRLIDHLHSIVGTKPQVRDQHIHVLVLEQLHRLRLVAGHINIKFVLKGQPQTIPGILLIINDQ